LHAGSDLHISAEQRTTVTEVFVVYVTSSGPYWECILNRWQ